MLHPHHLHEKDQERPGIGGNCKRMPMLAVSVTASQTSGCSGDVHGALPPRGTRCCVQMKEYIDPLASLEEAIPLVVQALDGTGEEEVRHAS